MQKYHSSRRWYRISSHIECVIASVISKRFIDVPLVSSSLITWNWFGGMVGVKWEGVSSVQSFCRVQLLVTLWTAARQASLSITDSQRLLKHMSIKSMMPCNHLILCHPLLPLPSLFPSIRVFSNESVLCVRWPMYWSFSFSISPSNDYSGLISFRMD